MLHLLLFCVSALSAVTVSCMKSIREVHSGRKYGIGNLRAETGKGTGI